MTDMNFDFYVGTNVLFGKDASYKAGEELAARDLKKVMIVTDKGIVNAGLLSHIRESITFEGIEVVVFDEVPPNPPSATVVKGVEVFNENNCDSLVAVGGGSSMDACKAISMMLTNDGDINDFDSFIGTRTFENPGYPVITIPTTAGTGSETTMAAVITNEKTHWKSSTVSPYMSPVVALVDPAITLGLPPHITAATGVDALTHAIEAYTAVGALNGKSPVSDALALQAIQLISGSLRQAYARGDNYEAREKMMSGSMIAGMAFLNVGLGSTHALAHPLGGYYDIPHGVANAILLPYVMKFNLSACPERYADIAKAMGENIEGLTVIEAAEKAVDAVTKLVKDTDIPLLNTYNVKDEDWQRMAEDAFKDNNSNDNPRKCRVEDLLNIYLEANNAR